MQRSDVPELHYITPIANLPSIMRLGILSNKQVDKIEHVSIAKEEVQERRSKTKIPGAGSLHDYVNLYFHARNPMLYKRRAQSHEICVLQIDSKILDADGIIISDRNAAATYVRFLTMEEGITSLNKDLVYALHWNHDDFFEKREHASIKCAEVLVPNRVPTEFIKGIYVANDAAHKAVLLLKIPLSTTINNDIFF